MIQRDRSAGLTLFETLIALAIMAMLAAILSSGLNFGIRSLDRSQRISDETAHALARRSFRDWLEHALIVPPPNGDQTVLSGTSTDLEFLADIAASDPRFDKQQPVLVSAGQSNAVFSAKSLPEGSSNSPVIQFVLAPEGTKLTFAYWGHSQPNQPPGWSTEWSGGFSLPGLVKITFEESALPPMVIRPGKALAQTEMSLSSLVPPALPSRP